MRESSEIRDLRPLVADLRCWLGPRISLAAKGGVFIDGEHATTEYVNILHRTCRLIGLDRLKGKKDEQKLDNHAPGS